ncbi:MAG: DUF305 domain-containing protein [Phycisphaerae bacterium]|nr:DUF305 domain-containing protein [Gemmatimonadaceae bacterium]
MLTGPGGLVTNRAAIERAKADSVRLPYTPADIGFMTGMIAHHAQAIVMSRLVPSRSTNQSVRTLAERIINAQEDEIVAMQRWLLNRRLPVPDPQAAGAHSMAGHGVHDMGGMSMAGNSMPGMLSSTQLAQLDSARGPGFDELYLTFMIQHHKGAVSMVKGLFASPAAGQDETIFKFASDVNVDQTTEVARMERMLVLLKFERKLP